jgi:hypothetical protein
MIGAAVAGINDGVICGTSLWYYTRTITTNQIGITANLCPNTSPITEFMTLAYGRVYHIPTRDLREFGPLPSPVMEAFGAAAPAAESADATNGMGRIPKAAFTRNGLDAALIPDFVAVSNRQGAIAGYIRKEDLLGKAPRLLDAPVPVVDENGMLVGSMYPGRGFVPAGEIPESVPPFEVKAYPGTK